MALHLAWQFEKAELFDEAVNYLLVAGRNATRMAAHKEAIAVLTRALGLLRRLPDSRERLQKELLIQSDLVIPLQVLGSYGTPERGHANQRAFELGLQIGDAAEQYEASVLQCSYLVARARYDEALALGEQLFDLARQLREPAKIASAHLVVGLSCLYRGQLARARIHLEQALAGYDPEHHRPEVSGLGQDLGVLGTSYLSWVLWLLGHPDQALQCSQDAVSAARRTQHPFSIGFALGIAGSVIRLRRGEYPEAQACAEELLGLWEEHSFALYQAWGWCVKGHALIERDSGEEGIALLEEGVRACESLSIIASHSQQLVNLADGFRKTGQTDEGLRALAEAMRVIEEHDERHFEAEAHRVKGELLRQRGDDPAAVEECFQRALDVARSQKAASWELRSATSLSRLWHHQGRTREARRLLASAYALFSEGMATEDLRKARTLLEATAAATIEEPRPASILRS
jgi:tetratricopeptide (TPR) repeat protein